MAKPIGQQARIGLARIYAAKTPKPGQDRKVAAIRDALGRRSLRVTPLIPGEPAGSPKKVGFLPPALVGLDPPGWM